MLYTLVSPNKQTNLPIKSSTTLKDCANSPGSKCSNTYLQNLHRLHRENQTLQVDTGHDWSNVLEEISTSHKKHHQNNPVIDVGSPGPSKSQSQHLFPIKRNTKSSSSGLEDADSRLTIQPFCMHTFRGTVNTKFPSDHPKFRLGSLEPIFALGCLKIQYSTLANAMKEKSGYRANSLNSCQVI